MEGWTFPTLLTIAIRVLETLFVLGVVGSAVVVVLTAIEDFKMHERPEGHPDQQD